MDFYRTGLLMNGDGKVLVTTDVRQHELERRSKGRLGRVSSGRLLKILSKDPFEKTVF